MFPELYNQYKVTKPYEIKPLNAQAELLTYLDSVCFAAHDLNLYLDNYPDDKEAIAIFDKYNKESKIIKNEYESKYGPLLVSSDENNTYPWAWNKSPWPWEND